MSTEHAADVVYFKREIQFCYFTTLLHYCCILINASQYHPVHPCQCFNKN